MSTTLHETTLDEAVWTTIWRDVKRIGIKLFHVLVPRTFNNKSQGVEALRDWDLWGPLLFCLLTAILLYAGAPSTQDEKQKQAIFAAVFVIVWVGAVIVTLNCMLLGGNISFFQSICLLGYCVFPLLCAAFLCRFIPNKSVILMIVHVIIVALAVIWSTVASVGFIAGMVPGQRKFLATYPVWLFYVGLGWMILMNFSSQASKPTTAPTVAPPVTPVMPVSF